MKKPLLHFEEHTEFVFVFNILNHEDTFLGTIEKQRVGKFMHWVFKPDINTFFTNGCLKEIVEFITSLYNKDKQKQEEIK